MYTLPDGDARDFYTCSAGQGSDLHRVTGRGEGAKVTGVDLVDLGIIVDVCQVDAATDDVLVVESGGTKYGSEIFEYTFSLGLDPARYHAACFRINGDLAGAVEGVPNKNGLAIWAYGGGCLLCLDSRPLDDSRLLVVAHKKTWDYGVYSLRIFPLRNQNQNE